MTSRVRWRTGCPSVRRVRLAIHHERERAAMLPDFHVIRDDGTPVLSGDVLGPRNGVTWKLAGVADQHSLAVIGDGPAACSTTVNPAAFGVRIYGPPVGWSDYVYPPLADDAKPIKPRNRTTGKPDTAWTVTREHVGGGLWGYTLKHYGSWVGERADETATWALACWHNAHNTRP